jgi:hypothetical protein
MTVLHVLRAPISVARERGDACTTIWFVLGHRTVAWTPAESIGRELAPAIDMPSTTPRRSRFAAAGGRPDGRIVGNPPAAAR